MSVGVAATHIAKAERAGRVRVRRLLVRLSIALFLTGPLLFFLLGGTTGAGAGWPPIATATLGLFWLIALVIWVAQVAVMPPFQGEIL